MAADLQPLLVRSIADASGGEVTSDGEVDLGVGGLRISAWVNGTQRVSGVHQVSVFLNLWGGELGESRIFASTMGYADSDEAAVAVGGREWAEAFVPVLLAALTGRELPEHAARLTATIQGRTYDCFVARLDRAMSPAGEVSGAGAVVEQARRHLDGDPWLCSRVLESGTLAILPRHRPAVLSVFCCEGGPSRIFEVKINGADWPAATDLLDDVPPIEALGTAFLRELVVAVPKSEPIAPSRRLIEHTLSGVQSASTPRVVWAGWDAHRGELGAPAQAREVARLERAVGELPADYRRFLLTVTAKGAGPGYGLISPFGAHQRALAKGVFAWEDGDQPTTDPQGVLALAHAGCGVMYLLVLTGPHRGEVWLDAAGSDQTVRRVAPSFLDWYQDWLDALVKDAPPRTEWDARRCSTPNAISNALEAYSRQGLTAEEAEARVGGGRFQVMAAGGSYFDRGEPVPPCAVCHELVASYGGHVAPGVEPKQARGGGFLFRLLGAWWRR